MFLRNEGLVDTILLQIANFIDFELLFDALLLLLLNWRSFMGRVIENFRFALLGEINGGMSKRRIACPDIFLIFALGEMTIFNYK
jgi:hypothetical protein